MNYTVIGTGAIGGYYGGRLMKAGRAVRFLLRSDYEYVKEHGLQIDSCDGSFHLDGVEAYNDTRQMPKTDVVLVCLKSINNHKLREMLPPHPERGYLGGAHPERYRSGGGPAKGVPAVADRGWSRLYLFEQSVSRTCVASVLWFYQPWQLLL